MKIIRWIYGLLTVLCVAFLGYSLSVGNRLQTDLTTLLPEQNQIDKVLKHADASNEKQLNTQVILLAGSTQSEKAFESIEKIAELWQKSGIFQAVDSQIVPDWTQMQADIQDLRLATLPEEQANLLIHDPKAYFQHYAEYIVNPFGQTSGLSLEQDWLGLGRFVGEQARASSHLQWNAENGLLFVEDKQGKTWVYLRGVLPEKHINGEKLLHLLAESRVIAQQNDAEILQAGGAIFASLTKQQAEKESQIMSLLGLGLTFALLWWAFRSWRVLGLMLPLLLGLVWGIAVAILIFDEIHILTLVIGTSLVGLLVDFPLHALTPALFRPSNESRESWQINDSIQKILPSFLTSLLITVLGYALLWFTPLPILRQTAVFSAFSLIGALGATVFLLPILFREPPPVSHRLQNRCEQIAYFLFKIKNLFKNRMILSVLMGVTAWGLMESNWRDDIRQWANLSPNLLNEMKQIAQLSGTDWGGQYVVLEAPNDEALWQKNTEIHQKIQKFVDSGDIQSVQSLNQVLLPISMQEKVQARLRELAKQPETWQALVSVGISEQVMMQALEKQENIQTLTPKEALQKPLMQAWQTLYLGEIEPQRVASIVRFQGVKPESLESLKHALSTIQGVHWADKRAYLNDSFEQTRNQAVYLKLISYVLAALGLCWFFGTKRGMSILLIPLFSAIMTVAILAYLHIPIGLFAMFGLLLISAIGVDYTVYSLTAPHSAYGKLGGMLLAAMTTGISFFLLAMSQTPAVASFGLTVGLGVILNFVLATWLLPIDFKNKLN